MKNENDLQSVNVKIEAFEGPLDLLYHLIEKNEIDIYDIPIASLTDQYLAYLDNVENRSMDGMSEFLLMAATLIEIKSKMLLPKPIIEDGVEIDPREELVARLIEYKRYKLVSQEFAVRSEEAALLFYKNPDKSILDFSNQYEESMDELLSGITIEDLYAAFRDVMQRREKKIDKVRSGFKAIEKDLFTIDDKISFLRDLLVLSPKINFISIFREKAPKMEIVVTFLALLELIKQKQVIIVQDNIFGDITITNNGCEIDEAVRA